MTRSDRRLFLSVAKQLAFTGGRLLVILISLGILAFVGFHVLAIH